MTTHPLLAGCLFAIAAFFALGAAWMACAALTTRHAGARAGLTVLLAVTLAIIIVAATAGRILL